MSNNSTLSTFLSLSGLILSMYAVYVEYKMEHKDPDDEFTALCDIEFIGASCSETFMRPQGKMASYFGLVPKDSALDLPNAAFGVFYYAYRHVFANNKNTLAAMITSILTAAAFVSTVWLAYQLTFVLGDLCVLCWSIHVINTTLFFQMIMTTTTSSSSSSIPSNKKKL